MAQLEIRLRFEFALLGMLVGGFVFWQVRAPLAGVHDAAGPWAVMGALAAAWAVLAVVATVLVAARHVRRLRSGPPGPHWLALPIPPGRLARHLGSESAAVAWWLVVPALALWFAAFGLAPAVWLAALGAPFAGILVLASRAGVAVGERLALRGLPPAPGRCAVERVLAAAAVGARRRRLPPARWSRVPPWLALCSKDLRLTLRIPALGRSFLLGLLLWAFSIAAWRLPARASGDRLDYLLAFVFALVGSAVFAQWLVALAASDPFATLRSLPLGLPSVWSARFAWALPGVAALLTGHAALARGLSPQALHLFLGWVGVATFAIAALAVNYGITLFPRADLAHRMLGLSLALAVAGSLMIPLLGWVVLATAVFHSARRLPRWHRLEDV
jgi:hypothetical protein